MRRIAPRALTLAFATVFVFLAAAAGIPETLKPEEALNYRKAGAALATAGKPSVETLAKLKASQPLSSCTTLLSMNCAENALDRLPSFLACPASENARPRCTASKFWTLSKASGMERAPKVCHKASPAPRDR